MLSTDKDLARRLDDLEKKYDQQFRIVFDEALWRETEETAQRAHGLIASGRTPPPVYEKRCESCSLLADCLPKTLQKRRSVKSYLTKIIGEP